MCLFMVPFNTISGVMSLNDVVRPPSIDEISSPISAQIFEFCDPNIFQETLQSSEVTSSPNCNYEEQNSSYTTSLAFPLDVVDDKFSTEPLGINKIQNDIIDHNANTNSTITATTTSIITTTTTATIPTANNSNLSIIFDAQDEIENDISASIDFSSSFPFSAPPSQYLTTTAQQELLDFASVQPQLSFTDVVSHEMTQYPADTVLPLMVAPPPLPLVYEEDCLSTIPPFVHLNRTVSSSSSSSCSFLDPPPLGSFLPGLGADHSGIFAGSMLMGTELQPKDLDFHGENGRIFYTDQLDMQAFGNESQQLGCGAGSSTPLSTEITSLEDSTFKVGKLSVEQRKEKIHRYMKKRNERNFTKKIKYACRKTLADSRPRVRGRFAKNDEFGETQRLPGNPHDDDDYDDVNVKEEDDLVDTSDIFANTSGVSSFKWSDPIQSWI